MAQLCLVSETGHVHSLEEKTEVHVCMWLSHAPPVVIVSYCSVLNWKVQLATLSSYVKVVATYILVFEDDHIVAMRRMTIDRVQPSY